MIRAIRMAWLVLALPLTAAAGDWPQWMGPNRDGVWAETGVAEQLPAGGPKVVWRKPVGLGYAGPAVANGKVYVHDFQPKSPIDFKKVNNPGARPKIDGQERVVCLDATTGDPVWQHAYDCQYAISYPGGPRCTPTVSGGKVYALGAEGHLFCLDAEKGGVIWSKEFKKDFGAKTPVWGFSAHPLVDGQKVVCLVGGPDALAVAFDKDTGKELWKAGNARETGYAPITAVEAGGKKQYVVWDPDTLRGLDADGGQQLWAVELKPAYGMSIMAPQQAGDLVYTAGVGGKGVMLRLSGGQATEVWRGSQKTGINPCNMTPVFDNGTLYGVNENGELMAVDAKTGKRLWQTASPVTGKRPQTYGTAFLVKNGDRYFIFNELGELVIAKLTPEKYEEVSRAKIIEPTNNAFGRDVAWMHPAFAQKCVFARNDKEIVCVSLAKE